jgi:ABC-type transport system involved in cytochrome c biogenesis permease subunit
MLMFENIDQIVYAFMTVSVFYLVTPLIIKGVKKAKDLWKKRHQKD